MLNCRCVVVQVWEYISHLYCCGLILLLTVIIKKRITGKLIILLDIVQCQVVIKVSQRLLSSHCGMVINGYGCSPAAYLTLRSTNVAGKGAGNSGVFHEWAF